MRIDTAQVRLQFNPAMVKSAPAEKAKEAQAPEPAILPQHAKAYGAHAKREGYCPQMPLPGCYGPNGSLDCAEPSQPKAKKRVDPSSEEKKPLSPDFDGNGVVDLSDLALILGQFGTNNAQTDIDGNGKVDHADLRVVLDNYGKTL